MAGPPAGLLVTQARMEKLELYTFFGISHGEGRQSNGYPQDPLHLLGSLGLNRGKPQCDGLPLLLAPVGSTSPHAAFRQFTLGPWPHSDAHSRHEHSIGVGHLVGAGEAGHASVWAHKWGSLRVFDHLSERGNVQPEGHHLHGHLREHLSELVGRHSNSWGIGVFFIWYKTVAGVL